MWGWWSLSPKAERVGDKQHDLWKIGNDQQCSNLNQNERCRNTNQFNQIHPGNRTAHKETQPNGCDMGKGVPLVGMGNVDTAKALVATSFQLPSNRYGCGKADYIHRLVGYVQAV